MSRTWFQKGGVDIRFPLSARGQNNSHHFHRTRPMQVAVRYIYNGHVRAAADEQFWMWVVQYNAPPANDRTKQDLRCHKRSQRRGTPNPLAAENGTERGKYLARQRSHSHRASSESFVPAAVVRKKNMLYGGKWRSRRKKQSAKNFRLFPATFWVQQRSIIFTCWYTVMCAILLCSVGVHTSHHGVYTQILLITQTL